MSWREIIPFLRRPGNYTMRVDYLGPPRPALLLPGYSHSLHYLLLVAAAPCLASRALLHHANKNLQQDQHDFVLHTPFLHNFHIYILLREVRYGILLSCFSFLIAEYKSVGYRILPHLAAKSHCSTATRSTIQASWSFWSLRSSLSHGLCSCMCLR